MENEEMYLVLAYLGYQEQYNPNNNYLYLYQKEQRLNARIGDKKDISQLLGKASTDQETKDKFTTQIKAVQAFVRKVKVILITENIDTASQNQYLKEQLDKVFNSLERVTYRRTFQDFYILWTIVSPLNFNMVKLHRHNILKELKDLIALSKQIPENLISGAGLDRFREELKIFHDKYSVDNRKIVLSEAEIKILLQEQDNKCAISGTALYWGDDIEIDHKVPLALGGKDNIDNLQAVHKDENRRKGIRQENNADKKLF